MRILNEILNNNLNTYMSAKLDPSLPKQEYNCIYCNKILKGKFEKNKHEAKCKKSPYVAF